MVPLSPLHVASECVREAGVAGVVTSTALVVTSQTAALLSVMVNVYVPTVATDTVYRTCNARMAHQWCSI
jgi:hypothetical protein